LVCEHDPAVLALFQRAFATRRVPTLMYQLYTPSIPGYLERAGAAANGSVWSTVSGTYGDALGGQFARSYRAAYGDGPGRSHAGIAYDEIGMLVSAWRGVEHVRDRRAVTRQLRRRPYRGVNGSYYFDHPGQHGVGWLGENGDPSLAQAHLVLQVQDGRHRIIAPGPYAEARFQVPAWFEQYVI
jgi:branched-chain amino acid transport system substrate-binding protein